MKLKDITSILNLFFLSGLLFLISCKNDKCLKSTGNVTKEIRSLEAFKTIDIYDHFNVYLKSDNVNKIEIETRQNLVPYIETSVADGVLTIRDLNTCGILKGYIEKNLFISIDTLTAVTIYDSAKLFTLDTLNVQNLRILFLSDIGSCNLTVNSSSLNLEIWYGAGDYIVKGKSENAWFYAGVLSFIYANEFETNTSYVFNESMGDCYVNAKRSLGVEIHESGNIYYYSEPDEINIINKSGTGKLIKGKK